MPQQTNNPFGEGAAFSGPQHQPASGGFPAGGGMVPYGANTFGGV